jgi:hypothetical protein
MRTDRIALGRTLTGNLVHSFIGMAVLLIGTAAHGATSAIEKTADRLLRQMGEHLAAAPQISFRIEELYDAILESGVKVQYRGTASAAVSRPNRLRVRMRGDGFDRQLWYDGERLSLYDAVGRTFADAPVPPKIDAMLDYVASEFGVTSSLSDLLYSSPYEILIEKVKAGYYLGRHSVRGELAHHLVFVQDNVDWQIWIADSIRPFPLKFVIHFKNEPGHPSYIAWLMDWDVSPELSESLFGFSPPLDATKQSFESILGGATRPARP